MGQLMDDDGVQQRDRQQHKRKRILNEKLKQPHDPAWLTPIGFL